VSSSWSWPSSELPMSQDLLQADDRFVEDRSYKLLIVDSIMNLFRSSAVITPRSQLTYRTRLLWSRRTIRETTGKLAATVMAVS